jgi:MFS family permease
MSDHSTRKWTVLIAIGISTFMSALDGSIVNTLLPLLGRSLGASVADVEWVVTVYLLVVSGLLLVAGRLGDLRGHKVIFLSGYAGFTLSSGCAAWRRRSAGSSPPARSRPCLRHSCTRRRPRS